MNTKRKIALDIFDTNMLKHKVVSHVLAQYLAGTYRDEGMPSNEYINIGPMQLNEREYGIVLLVVYSSTPGVPIPMVSPAIYILLTDSEGIHQTDLTINLGKVLVLKDTVSNLISELK